MIAAEKELSPKGKIDPGTVSPVGSQVGPDHIVMGEGTDARTHAEPACMKKVKVGGMLVTKSPETQFGGEDISLTAEDVSRKLYKDIYHLIHLQSVVTKVDGGKFYINLGKKNYIAVGRQFSPVIPGIPIPLAGKESDQSIILKVTEIYDTYCVATVTKGTATNIEVGTIVSAHY